MATRVVVPLLQQELLNDLTVAQPGPALTPRIASKVELAWIKPFLLLPAHRVMVKFVSLHMPF